MREALHRDASAPGVAPVTAPNYRAGVASAHAPVSAITPGTDLPVHARALVRVHDAYMSGTRSGQRPRPVVARSWARVLGLGLDPTRPQVRDPLGAEEVERLRRESPLSLVMPELRQVLGSVADASRFLVVVTDADGTILWREGSARVRLRADDLGFSTGATWTEEHVGTNAIGTALAEAAPVQLFSAEHFELEQHPWYCTAAPLHDPRTGDLLGVVDVSGPAMTLHPAILALVETAARLAEARLWTHHLDALARLRQRTEHLVAATSGPLLVVDDHGWVAHHSGVAAQDRVAVPDVRRDAVLPVAVPGLGLCAPERITGGWLLRPQGTERATIRGRLVLEPTPALELVTPDGGWTTPLSRRHAQLLAAIHRSGPAGTTAASLSTALYGDTAHEVTVRAEISRLRRVLGGLVTASPYRVAAEARLEIADGPVGQPSA